MIEENGNLSSELIISEEVIATIAANAVKDVDGVAGLGTKPVDVVSMFKPSTDGLKYVDVTVTSYDIRIHVYVILYSDHKISEVSSEIQRSVKQSIQNMTGRVVTRVDVTVTGCTVKNKNEPVENPVIEL